MSAKTRADTGAYLPNSMASRDLSTELIHHAYTPPAGFAAPQPGVHKASTVIFPSVAAMRARDWRSKAGYTYGLHGTPTTFTLEERIATLEGGNHCLLAPSGLAAIALVNLALLQQGDAVLLPHNVYLPSRELARTELARFGITLQLYDAMDPASLVAAITAGQPGQPSKPSKPNSRLLWLEAPGSVTMEFPDLAALVGIGRAHGLTIALDNTWGAGVALNGFELGSNGGADIVMQALTKYPSGGGDVLMGSVVTRDGALHARLKAAHMHLGIGVAANDVEAVLRALPSLPLRYAAQDAAGRQLAAWLATRPEVRCVLHPALPDAPGHAHWRTHCSGAAGLFSLLLDERYSAAQADAFAESLQLFKLGYSWAGPVSLVVPYDLASMRGGGAGPEHLRGHLLRLSVGLEAACDLQADLAQALERALG